MKALARVVSLVLGLLAIRAEISLGQQSSPPDYARDPRRELLVDFLTRLESPAAMHVEDFLLAADRNSLDWRLLPSIAILESGGGKNFRNNNIFGWDSGRQSFPTIQAGIHTVASRLANSKLYKGKNLRKKLAVYNPHGNYPSRTLRLMNRIAPSDPLPTSPVEDRTNRSRPVLYSSIRTP